MIKCRVCRRNRRKSSYFLRSDNGKTRTECKDCTRAIKRRDYVRHEQAYKARARKRTGEIRSRLLKIVEDARNVECMDCHGRYSPWVMDFDHRSGSKIGNIAELKYKWITEDKLLKEISKCDVVCSNCHRERTHRRRHNLPLIAH